MTLLAALLHAGDAQAQNAGADHYEVTIAPPPRPGSAPLDPAASSPGSPSSAPSSSPSASKDGARDKVSQPAAGEPASARTPEPSAPVPAGPLRSLQVGAYRQRRSADQMQEKLGDAFGEVQVVEVESGGEKLYRVRVGKLPAGPALTDLKSRLLAAGYPAFEVELGETR